MALTFVPTPLGNLRDITLRSLDALRDATLIVAEDSRVARRLLSAYEIAGKEIWTYHEHNARSTTAAILGRAATEPVAVVTDAGTPGISDPGNELIAAARAAGIGIEVLPGAAAFVCAAVLSGFSLRRFTFEGFPPRTAGERRAAFARALTSPAAGVWYEAPHRIHKTLAELERLAPGRRIFLVRELSKIHEQQILGTPAQLRAALSDPARGEIAFVIEGTDQPIADASTIDLERAIDASLAAGESVSAIAKRLAESGAGERRHLYALISARKRESGSGGQPS
ncbi:MAG TPA: 16S rRNA (cytidine(1402)-2'-O)-methyltransferase [Candidatus Binatia bacterium]|nr:16S rRNA (cytidine(1402)-2'-O)-methyltransferase [Candidatus Binatia bacterium]